MSDISIENKLSQIESDCDNYLKSLGVKIKHNPEFDKILEFNLDKLRLLDEEQCAEYATLAALYSLYIQTETNRHSRKLKWSNHNLDIVIGKYSKNYGDKFTKYEEKRAGIICENQYASKLNEVIKESTIYLESLNFIARKIEAISNTLLELKKVREKSMGPKNLGCMNGWKYNPPEYDKCIKEKHNLTITNLGNCYNKYTCDKCYIYYTVDSSG